MHILITGGNGFIGQALVRQLAAAHRVQVLDVQTAAGPDTGVAYTQGDYGNRTLLDRTLPGVDLVIHLAHSSVPSDSAKDPVFELQSNVLSTIRLMEAMEFHRVPRLIYFSSGGAVYGNKTAPCSETDMLDPMSNYGISKATTEFFVRQFERNHALNATIVRPSNVFGARTDKFGRHGVISTMLHCLRTGERFSVWGSADIAKDYIYIDDLTAIVHRLVENPYSGTLNAGSGQLTSIARLMDICQQVSGKTLDFSLVEPLSGDVPTFSLNVAALRTLMPQLAFTPLESAIDAMWQTYQGKHA
jgi:UDP-glucose 4-epimerase